MSSKQERPSWAYMIAGIVIGLFISFLIYLSNLPSPKSSDLKKPASSLNFEKESSETPTFDFYKILPELEVVVPELEVNINKRPSRPDNKPTTSKSTQLAAGEKFILQAGSFSQFNKADELKASLALLGIEAHIEKVSIENKAWHRVLIGPFTNRNVLNKTRGRLQKNNINAIALKTTK